MRTDIFKHRRVSSALVMSLAMLFWAAQTLLALDAPAFCQMKSAVGQHSSHSAASSHSHGCCCGHADSRTGIKGQCCEVREAERSARPDLAVSLVTNLTAPDPTGLVAESRCSADSGPFTGTMGAADWVQSKSLTKPIYLSNLKFLC